MNTGIASGVIKGWEANKTAKRYGKFGVQKGRKRVTKSVTEAVTEDKIAQKIPDKEPEQQAFPF